MERRTFLNGLVAGAMAAQTAAAGQVPGSKTEINYPDPVAALPRTDTAGEMRGEMLYRKLGATGEVVSAIGMGGSHISKAEITQAEATHMIHEALDRGLNFLDNSWDYNEGRGETYVGNALAESGYRKKAFVMTKVDGRNKETARQQIDDSLRRLKVDHIDLLQHHEVLRFDDPDRIFAEEGSMEAFLDAKKAGKIRFIGFTGHKDPHIHLYTLQLASKHGFKFDTVQMPLNVMDAHFRSFAQLVVPHLVEANIGVLGMKPFGGGDGIILKSNTVQPLDCLHYALSLPTSVVITGIDKKEILDQAFAAVKGFKPLDSQELATLLSKTRDAAENGHYELFKTTSHFDTTARHPDWLGADNPNVQKLAPQLPG